MAHKKYPETHEIFNDCFCTDNNPIRMTFRRILYDYYIVKDFHITSELDHRQYKNQACKVHGWLDSFVATM